MKTGYVYIDNHVFETLLAISAQEQQLGLMFQDPPVPNMSFIYGVPGINKFWMSNTKAPLDIVFVHKNKISEICYGEPYSTSIIGSNLLSDLVIELPFGTVQSSNIKIGQNAGLLKPSLEELNFSKYSYL